MSGYATQELRHASAVAVNGNAVLILGASGSGKSGLALELMSRGALLIADDQSILTRHDGEIFVTAPETIRGQIEARGVGILAADTLETAPLCLVVDLATQETERLPEMNTTVVLGQTLELINGANLPNIAAIILQYLKGGRIA